MKRTLKGLAAAALVFSAATCALNSYWLIKTGKTLTETRQWVIDRAKPAPPADPSYRMLEEKVAALERKTADLESVQLKLAQNQERLAEVQQQLALTQIKLGATQMILAGTQQRLAVALRRSWSPQ